jgi:hypothetical protein
VVTAVVLFDGEPRVVSGVLLDEIRSFNSEKTSYNAGIFNLIA